MICIKQLNEQVFFQLFYGKNGSGPQIKRAIRKFAGFEDGEKQKKIDLLLTFELPAIKQTAAIIDLQDIKKDETKENIAKAIVEFLMVPTGKTFEEVQKDEPEEEEASEPEEEEEEEVKPKPKKGRGGPNAGRPKRATASRVWTNGKHVAFKINSSNFKQFLDYGSSEDEEIEEARPRVGRKKRGDDSDSGSDVSYSTSIKTVTEIVLSCFQYNPSGGASDSEGDRRKSSRNAPSASARPTRGSRGKRRGESESEEESEEDSEDLSEEEVAPAKKKKASVPNRSTPKRGAVQKGRKRKQETESEEEASEEEDDEQESDDSEVRIQQFPMITIVTNFSLFRSRKNQSENPASPKASPNQRPKRKTQRDDRLNEQRLQQKRSERMPVATMMSLKMFPKMMSR